MAECPRCKGTGDEPTMPWSGCYDCEATGRVHATWAILIVYGVGGALAMAGMWAMFHFNCCG